MFGKDFKTNLRKLIIQSGLQNKEFAVQIGTNGGTLAKYLKGMCYPTPKVFNNLARIVGKSHEELSDYLYGSDVLPRQISPKKLTHINSGNLASKTSNLKLLSDLYLAGHINEYAFSRLALLHIQADSSF